MQPDRTRCTESGRTMETGYVLDCSDAGFRSSQLGRRASCGKLLRILKYDRKLFAMCSPVAASSGASENRTPKTVRTETAGIKGVHRQLRST
jgi:hypothetical protein